MQQKLKTLYLFVGFVVTTALLWGAWHASPMLAQDDGERRDDVCRELFPEVYEQFSLDDIYCVNETFDEADYSVINPPNPLDPLSGFDGVCDSDPDETDWQCTLRAALMEANAPPASDNDIILLPPGVYLLTRGDAEVGDENSNRTGDLDIISDLIIRGYGREVVFVDAGALNDGDNPTPDRVFHVREAGRAVIEKLTVTGGRLSSNRESEFLACGGILNDGQLTLRESLVQNYNGAGVYQVTIEDQNPNPPQMLIENTIIDGTGSDENHTVLHGLFVGSGIVTLDNTTIQNNKSVLNAGSGSRGRGMGMHIAGNAVVNVLTSTITNNRADGKDSTGGGIYINSINNITTTVTLRNSTISNNQAENGGGIYTTYGGNNTRRNIDLQIYESTISGNEARYPEAPDDEGLGGGIYHGVRSRLLLQNSTVSSNLANYHGGGIYVADELNPVSIENSTIAFNLANRDLGDDGDGGGIYVDGSGNIEKPTVYMARTILADNIDGSIADNDQYPDCDCSHYTVRESGTDILITGCLGQIETGGYNLIRHNGDDPNEFYGGIATGCEAVFPASPREARPDLETNPYVQPNLNNDWVGGRVDDTDDANITGPIDPQLRVLRNNGSVVQTHALITSDEPSNTILEKRSLAIDAIPTDQCLLGIDQRGAIRPQDGTNDGTQLCDIGAYEVVPQDVSIFMDANVDVAASGQTVEYILEYVNQGSLNASNVVIFNQIDTDVLQNLSFTHEPLEVEDGVLADVAVTQRSGTSFVWDVSRTDGVTDFDLKPGDGGRIVITGIVDPNLLNTPPPIRIIPRIELDETDGIESNNSIEVTTFAIPGADLAVTVTPAQNPSPVRQRLIYTARVTNLGPAAAQNVVLFSTLPSGVNYSNNGSSESCEYDSSTRTVACTVTFLNTDSSIDFLLEVTPQNTGDIIGRVEVSSDLPDQNSDNNTAEVTVAIRPDVDLAVSVTTDPVIPRTGELLSYQIEVRNNGPQTSGELILRTNLPDNVTVQNVDNGLFTCEFREEVGIDGDILACTLAQLGNNSTASIDVNVIPLSVGELIARMWVETTSADSDATNDTIDVVTTIQQGTTPVPTLTPTSATTNTPTPTNTPEPGVTPTLTPTTDPAATATNTPEPGSTATPTPTVDSVETATPSNTATPSPTPTATATSGPTATPTNTATAPAPGSEPVLDVRPLSLIFQAAGGSTPITSQTFAVENDGDGELSWTGTTSADWLGLLPETGTASADSPATVEVFINPRGLTAGPYNGQITISSETNGVLDSPQVVNVSLILNQDAADRVERLATFDSAGGTLYIPGQDAWVQADFAADTFSRETEVTLVIKGESAYPTTGGLRFLIDRVFEVTAIDQLSGPVTEFSPPYQLTVSYQFRNFDGVTDDRETIDLYYWDTTSQAWQRAYDDSCAACTWNHDLNQNTFTVSLDHMTEFALMSQGASNAIYLPLVRK